MSVGNSFVRSYGSTDFITGLRAIAATMVVIIYTGAFLEFGTIGFNITMAGKYGVDFFFCDFRLFYCKNIHGSKKLPCIYN